MDKWECQMDTVWNTRTRKYWRIVIHSCVDRHKEQQYFLFTTSVDFSVSHTFSQTISFKSALCLEMELVGLIYHAVVVVMWVVHSECVCVGRGVERERERVPHLLQCYHKSCIHLVWVYHYHKNLTSWLTHLIIKQLPSSPFPSPIARPNS